jgi:uncharacterized protein
MTAVVLDTSVIIAAHLSPRGAASDLLGAFYANRIRLTHSPAIVTEYAEVMARPKFAAFIGAQDRIAFLMKLRASGLAITPVPVPDDDWPDPDDLPFVAAALATAEKLLVILNPRDFAPAPRHGVHVFSTAEARRRLL